MKPNSNRQLVVRDVSELVFDDLPGMELHNLALKIPGYILPLDIGAWCYARKQKCDRRNYKDVATLNYHAIDLKSSTTGRVHFVRRIIYWLIWMENIGLRPKTIKANFGQFLIFLKWCDAQKVDYLSVSEQVVLAYKEYSEVLIHKFTTNQLSINTAHAYQSVVKDALSVILDEEFVAEILSVNRIKRSLPNTVLTKPPNPEIAASNLRLLYTVFNSLSDFILQFSPFPLRLELEHDTFCLFPHRQLGSVPVSSGVGVNITPDHKKFFAYNFSSCRLSTVNEVIEAWSKQRTHLFRQTEVRDSMRAAAIKLEEANTNSNHASRLKMCKIATSCFMMLFISATGMNLNQVIDLRMNQFTENSNRTITFHSQKARAGGKPVTFLLSEKSSVEFLKFLVFRKFVITTFGLQESNHVFFEPSTSQLKAIKMSFSTTLHEYLSSWFKFNNLVTAKEWRVFKSHNVINRYGFVKAAAILQNRPSTILRSYSATPKDSDKFSVSKFFESYSDIIVKNQTDDLENVAVGMCTSVGEPSLSTAENTIKPNCKNHEGCLFCKNYRVHSDLTDIIKLLSFKYVLSETIHLYRNKREFKQRHDTIYERIDQLISLIKQAGQITDRQISKVQTEIMQGFLSPYWRRKMELLIDLDVV